MIRSISNDYLQLEIDEQDGEILSFCEKDGTDILQNRRKTTDRSKDGGGGFFLLPVANRIRNNSYTLYQKQISPAFCPEGNDSYLHGYGWCSAWNTEQLTPNSVTLQLIRNNSKDGYDFEALVTLTLKEKTLSVDLQIEHRGQEPRLYGLGFHPYFATDENTKLQMSAAAFYNDGEGHFPVGPYPDIPKNFDFSEPQNISDSFINCCYTGFNGLKLYRPYKRTVSLRSDAPYLMMYRYSKAPFIALEPQTHVTDGCNAKDKGGMKVLNKTFSRMGLYSEITLS